ncbi:intein N-terminal splicing region [Persephonella hydrogeniphila]|uniref:Intein N-terminal splicing region n=1 Tax=Persephonella hydrogeniphila TaxID=198703 RepID=A0A285NCW0_9AQUI|nr:hypothetical protein [Persephonella hydrogeniphila]SNZ06777.1 intein N-terminal splicing region [Persephonella hydrogeniphila]
MEEGLRKEVESNFKEVFSYIKTILEEELSSTDSDKIEDGTKISVELEDLYEDWIDKIDSAPLPELEKIEEIEHNDGIHLKIVYSLTVDEAKQIRKIKIKSNGKVDVYNYIQTEKDIDGKKFLIKIEYDTYGNLIFTFEKVE